MLVVGYSSIIKLIMEPTLPQYVEHALGQGKSQEQIYQELLKNGWSVAEIAAAFQNSSVVVPALEQSEDTQKKTTSIITILGAIFVGAGIFSFIAANWDGMGDFAKVSIILVSLITVNLLAWYFKERKEMPRSGGALFLLGGIIYGAGIFLVGQIFNIRLDWPDGFMLWMIGCLAMGFAINSYGQIYLGLLAGVVAIIGHPFVLIENPLSLTSFAMTPAFLLVASVAITLISGWYVRKNVPAEQKEYF